MKDVHRPEVTATIKYLYDTKLVSIRVGEGKRRRSSRTESIDDCYVYNLLNRRSPKNLKRQYIYVKDLSRPDDVEIEMLGDLRTEVQHRADGHYKSFIAMPLRSGRTAGQKRNELWVPANDLGFVGFDCRDEYGFGSLREAELEYLACLVDLMSEPVQDLIDARMAAR